MHQIIRFLAFRTDMRKMRSIHDSFINDGIHTGNGHCIPFHLENMPTILSCAINHSLFHIKVVYRFPLTSLIHLPLNHRKVFQRILYDSCLTIQFHPDSLKKDQWLHDQMEQRLDIQDA